MIRVTRRTALAMVGSAAMVRPVYGAQTKPLDVIVIGAGLSGLNAALILKEQGLSVRVLEARARAGGRVKTMIDVSGKPEGGGQYIGASYARMIAAMQRFGLAPKPAEGGPLSRYPWAYHIRGQWVMREDWPSSRINPLSGEDRKVLPHQLLGHVFRDSPLRGKPADAWLSPEMAKWDDLSGPDYLRSRGHNQATIDLTGVWVHTDSFAITSALYEMQREQFNQQTAVHPSPLKLFEIEGGNSRLPEAMAAALGEGAVMYGQVVSGVASDDTGVVVECIDGASHRARYAIVTLPLPLLRNVLFSPGLPPALDAARHEMENGLSVRVYMGIREPYWEKDGMPANMWTDTPIDQFEAMRRGPNGEFTVMHAYINGAEARPFRFMTDAQCFEYVATVAARIRPSMRGILTPIAVQSCSRDPFGAGDWVYWKTGQIRRFGNRIRDGLPRVSFCGEHTAIMQRGMEGAMESGERAELELLDRV